MGGFDGHIHTWEGSRESIPVKEVVKKAIGANLDAIAITDHNSVSAIDEAIKLAQNEITIVPGIELDAIYEKQKVHILCLFPNYKHSNFQKDLDNISRGRRERMFSIINKFAENNLISNKDISELIAKLESQAVYTTMSVSEILMDKYKGTESRLGKELADLESIYNYTTPEGKTKGNINLLSKFMYEFLGKNSPYYVPYEEGKIPNFKEVTEFCLKYNGPCGFAHIFEDLREKILVEKAFNDGVDAGMVLIGAGHPKHDDAQQKYLLELIQSREIIYKNQKIYTIPINGTDYHAKPRSPDSPDIGEIKSPIDILTQIKKIIV